MLVPLAWLRDYVAFDLAPDALAEQLTLRGMEVKGITVSGADWTDVVVGRLLNVERHPNADKLWLTTVDAGDAEPLRIVCGADNVRTGQLVPVARVGAVLPGGRRIERSKIRGVESEGMLCSPIELGLGNDAEGILILGTNDEHPVGADLAPLLGEVVLDVDVKPNRGDALSMVGLAREVAAFSGGELRMPEASVSEDPTLRTADHASVMIEDAVGCPRFTARWFDDVSNGPSPAWMQQRLLAGARRRAAADDRSRGARARRPDAGHRRSGAGDRAGGDHGRSGHRGDRGDDASHPRIGHLPRPHHPQHGPAAWPSLRGEHAARERDRACPAAHRRRP